MNPKVYRTLAMKRLLFLLMVLIPVIFLVLIFVVTRGDETIRSTRSIHISIRPTGASPVTVSLPDGTVVGVFITPEIDIEIAEDIQEINVDVPTYQQTKVSTSEPIIVINLTLEDEPSIKDEIFETLTTDKIFNSSSGYSVKNPRSYADGRWIYGLLVTDIVATDGERIVIEVSSSGDKLIFGGTDIDKDSLIEKGVPEDIADAIERDSAYDN
jgi:hypothetical protein